MDIPRLRLASQSISRPIHRDALGLARHMGAMQAQDYYGALWSIGLRTGLTEKEVITALESLSILRTWPQRGTIHVVPAEDASWLVGLSADRLLQGARTRRESLGLDDETLARSELVLRKALADKAFMSRPEVMATLEAAGISTGTSRGYHILWNLSQRGITFIGPMEGKQQTFGLLEGHVASVKYSRADGMARLARRYFTSHGPATLQDFMWWSGLTSADAKAAIASNDDVLMSHTEGKQTYWYAKNTPPVDGAPAAYLLPGFDEYMLGYKDRSAVLAPENFKKIVPGSNGIFLPTIVVDGQIVGTWKRTIKKDHVTIELMPFTKLTQAELKLIETPAAVYGAFLGLPAKLL